MRVGRMPRFDLAVIIIRWNIGSFPVFLHKKDKNVCGKPPDHPRILNISQKEHYVLIQI